MDRRQMLMLLSVVLTITIIAIAFVLIAVYGGMGNMDYRY